MKKSVIKPINYKLIFEPDLKKFSFKGNEILLFEVVDPTKKIELDLVELKITDCRLQINQRNKIDSYQTDKQKEKLTIFLSQKLEPGIYELFIEFTGILNDKLAGFYRSKYSDKGKEKYIATTQFEAADAKRAFPCVDHPAYKGTFDVSFIIDKNLSALSNTLPKRVINLKRQANLNSTSQVKRGAWQRARMGKKMVIFERTPLMSTYLLYLGVGEFEFIEDKYRDILLRVVTTPGKKEYGKFALDCSKKFLKFYEEYFDYPYPLKKLDLIAVPDFASGAMENWGAITFRENALLLYPNLSSRATMERIAEVVAHELVHQWFGNLVTMKWWDDLWLNESFATYMAYKALDKFWPEWKVWSGYLTYAVFGAMSLDGLKSTRSIHAKVLNPHEIDELFDEIAYEKGGSILRMIHEYLGPKVYRDGLRNYIRKFEYANAEADDLWSSLQDASRKPVKEIMRKYVLQKGFPLVELSTKGRMLNLKQERFFYLDYKDESKWIIPLVFKLAKKSYAKELIERKEKKIPFKKSPFLYLNTDYSSFFISKYDSKNLLSLGKHIQKLNELEKIGLIHDLFSLVTNGKMELKECLDFLETHTLNEKREEVLQYMIGKLSGVYLLIRGKKIKKLILYFASKSLKLTGANPKEKEDINITHLRNTALSSLSSLDDKKTQEFIRNKFEIFVKTKVLHPDLRGAVYSGAVWQKDFYHGKIKELFEKSTVQEEKAKLLMSLGNSKNAHLIRKTLDYGLTGRVRFSDLFYLIAAVSRNRFATEEAYDWCVRNWDIIKKKTGGHSTVLLRRMLKMIVPIGAVRKVNDAITFLETHRIVGLERTYEQVKEELLINSRLVKRLKR
ncbi:hypothetical protein A2866_00485 [Candidatus Roizmanbacteria bacterium RIFCSPHIGHO2_01_FULL_39_8]|uniref:Aminopeptidase n=3 Tax=Candidatus Roizmaniibacteriota TaxID=1752723 RepID=A0A1F7GG45_9BACT|nr:MAG: hypothetical protein A2866_00485 [Candidatus Roizmanbacteria bacterium RIFCSPHIGHO2_01_FULL_39_8]OGK28144.1 MAG: hypothetical protein A3C28_05600 [Candidatus Roizmanbacteria bacterium RIFCSPHIGHO2_02_FULL_39_9]OGK37063.1 MAG: hypothetical protein A3F60_02370 [Candidatus Roizmanbacteria bacterium RIFCSPHIGHO2_12_FULL_39_8]